MFIPVLCVVSNLVCIVGDFIINFCVYIHKLVVILVLILRLGVGLYVWCGLLKGLKSLCLYQLVFTKLNDNHIIVRWI